MRHWLAASLLGLACTCAPHAATGEDSAALIAEMLRDVGAERLACPSEVLEGTGTRKMGAVCARFDGDFELFEFRWMQHLGRRASRSSGPWSRTVPQTAWEIHGDIHERIYTMGRTALGVRFFHGEILIVYK